MTKSVIVLAIKLNHFYQANATSAWRSTGSLPAEAASGNSVQWLANVPAGSLAWITVVDHSGRYRQSSTGTVVQSSGNSSCLEPIQTASVITQTVYMSSDTTTPASSSLDNKALLIVAVVFGILFSAALCAIMYMWSKLRQARRTRSRTDRFGIAGMAGVSDDTSSIFEGGPEYTPPSVRSSHRNSRVVTPVTIGSAAADRQRKISSGNASTVRSPTSPVAMTPYQGDDFDEKHERTPDRTSSENNPFIDPPQRSPTDTGRPLSQRSVTMSSLSSFHPTMTPVRSLQFPPSQFGGQRPGYTKSDTGIDSLSSATSMQLFGTGGGLRVTNDPRLIPTPDLSRVTTQASDRVVNGTASSTPMQPTPSYDTSSSESPSHRQRNDSITSEDAQLLSNSRSVRSSIYSHDSHATQSSRVSGSETMSTSGDHYALQPHSSRMHMIARKDGQ
ncbi:hypothetical protein EMMF5_001592 [Cystobasidiomycetes sp. EMM_F5]